MEKAHNQRLEEDAWELFVNAYESDYAFQEFVYEKIFSFEDQWRTKHYGSDEQELQRAFETMMAWDYERFLQDPIETTKLYVERSV